MVPARLPGLTELAKRSVYCVPGCEAEECERHSFVAQICTLAQLNICHLEQARGIYLHTTRATACPPSRRPHVVHCPASHSDQHFEVGVLLLQRHGLAVQLALVVPLHRLEREVCIRGRP